MMIGIGGEVVLRSWVVGISINMPFIVAANFHCVLEIRERGIYF